MPEKIAPPSWGTARVLIVDDDALARTALANVLGSRNDVEFFDTAESGDEALEKLQRENYDVLLLDIHLPGLSGLELLDSLGREHAVPCVIFVTAHHQYAVQAFEHHAVDYVLKPFSKDRIAAALDAAMRRMASERAARLMEMVPQLRSFASKSQKIAIKMDGRILFIDPAEVISAEAQGNYVLLVRSSGSYLFRGSITTVGAKLRPYGFIRIHRSVLMNTSWVQEIQADVTGTYRLRTKTGQEYTVSRTYKENLKSLAQFWIGGEPLFAV
ncbi:MAG: LytTR family DNA-binding domain-containing protein [Candidatus Acidiferrales bacterium]|jgi:two-component system, LytTR family, response regulator